MFLFSNYLNPATAAAPNKITLGRTWGGPGTGEHSGQLTGHTTASDT